MRPGAPSHTGTRGSALWGRGGRDERSSALWGRGGRSATLLTIALAFLLLPAAGLAERDIRAVVPADLLAEADANPNATFAVIVQGDKVADRVENGKGKLKRAFRSVNGAAATVTGEQLLDLARDSHVAVITRDSAVRTSAYEDNEIWRDAVAARPLWNDGFALSGATPPAIAIVDSGIDASKADDFGSRIVARVNFSSLEPNATGDPSGHGTMVAGVAAGGAAGHRGVAPNAPLVDVRVAASTGEARTSDVLAGIDWILANKAQYNIRVANFSLGGGRETSFRYDPLDKAVEKLWLSGVVVVASAGNQGSPTGPVKLGAPANDPFVITVGAVDTDGTAWRLDDDRAPWSAYGRTSDGFAKPELSAPGRFMVMPVPAGAAIPARTPDRVLGNGYMWMSGTSFAAPVVSGAAAQLLARRPNLTPDQVKGALMASANRLRSAGTGIGEVNVAGALGILSPPNPNEGLFAFVSNGTFDSAAWARTVSSLANWTMANWVDANWAESNWVESNWVESNWVESNWVESNWAE